MEARAERPCDVIGWFDAVPHLLSEHHWDVAARAGQSSFTHCQCPWGGHLVKFALSGIQVHGLGDAGIWLVRPETRAAYEKPTQFTGTMEMLEQVAPGDSIVRQPAEWGLLPLSSLIFGNSKDADSLTLSDPKTPVVCRQQVYRACPTERDNTLMVSRDASCDPADALLMCRYQTSLSVDVIGVVSVSEERFEQWMSTHLTVSLDRAIRTATWFLNRPGIEEMRAFDMDMYMILSIHSCKRGPPLLPLPNSSEETPLVTITTDERIRHGSWIRMPLGDDGRFRFSSFVTQFATNLGLSLEAYDVMDGRRLVHYQCAVRRSDWECVFEKFQEAFLVQKRAYRRANGGAGAPCLCQGAEPRFAPNERLAELSKQLRQAELKPMQHRVVVRRTFVEIAQDGDSEDEGDICKRPTQRAKTTPVWPSSESSDSMSDSDTEA